VDTLAQLHTVPDNAGKKNDGVMRRQVLQRPYYKIHYLKIEKQQHLSPQTKIQKFNP